VIFAETVFTFPPDLSPQQRAQFRAYTDDDVIFRPSRIGYRFMCRFMTFVQNHPLMSAFDWYWRVDDDSQFLAPFPYDPFELMAAMDKTFGWTTIDDEHGDMIREFLPLLLEHRQKLLARGNTLGVDIYDKLSSHPVGHFPIFYNNFEIGKLSFWREPRVREYLAAVDASQGTLRYRWGDAPIRSGAVSLFLPADQIHYFSDLQYTHDPENQFGRLNVGENCMERWYWRFIVNHGLSFYDLDSLILKLSYLGAIIVLLQTVISSTKRINIVYLPVQSSSESTINTNISS
jgi:hypothetical protein